MKYYLILAVSSVAMFLVVLQMRPDLVNIGFSPTKEARPTAEPPQTPEKKKNPVEASAANRQRRAAEVSYPSTADNPESNLQKDRVPSTPTPQPVVQQRFEQTATVEGDSVSVYATNSLDSRVLTVLKKGDQVQTNVAILDKEGSWSLIRVPDQKILGYVLRENLEQKRRPANLENQ